MTELLDATIHGIGAFDYEVDTGRGTFSPNLYELLGLRSGQKLSAEAWASIIHRDDRDRVLREAEAARANRRPLSQVYRIVRPSDGATRWVMGQSTFAGGREGSPLRYIGGVVDITNVKKIEEDLQSVSNRLDAILNNTRMSIFMMDENQHCVFMNRAAEQLTGYAFEETCGRALHDVVHHTHPDGSPYPLSECPIDRAFPERNQTQGEEVFVHKNGSFYHVAFTASPIADESGAIIGTIIEAENIDFITRRNKLAQCQNSILEMSVYNKSLSETLNLLISNIEDLSSSGLIASILLVDSDNRLRHVASCKIPQSYIDLIDGVEIGARVGSCGTAAFTKSPVYVSDIANDPLWTDFRDAALSHNLAACWSTPILSGSGEVLGTFAMYYSEPRDAPPEDQELIQFVQRSASLVMQRHRDQAASEQQAQILDTLNRIGASLAQELDQEKIVQLVTDSATQVTSASFGAFFYTNKEEDDDDTYMLYTLSGAKRSDFERFPMVRNTPLFQPTFSGEEIVRSYDITQDSRHGKNPPFNGMPKGHLPVRSYLAVPVVSRSGFVIGALLLGHPEPGRFSQAHEELVKGIAGQAAIAMDNARLFASAQKEIADRRRAEEALRDLNNHLEDRVAKALEEREATELLLRQAQKMEAVGQLTGGIAHDFNNLLTIISGNLESLKRKLGENAEPRLRRAVESATIGAERAATLTQRLLAFSRRQPLNPRVVNPNGLIAEMRDMLRRTLGEAIDIKIVLGDDVGSIEIDTHQLESALINLAVNARDAINESDRKGYGRLVIRTASQSYVPANGILGEGSSNEYICISVSDNGAGMSEETRAKAFEPFYTTKQVGKGTGLGLSMVYGFANQSGGHVHLDSTLGEGTTISLLFPKVEAHIDAHGDNDQGQDLAFSASATVLVCEDDDDVRAFTVEALRDLGYRVLEAYDADSATGLLQRQTSPVDLLLTDVVLPGSRDGVQLARDATQIQPGIRVLFVSGYPRAMLADRTALEKGTQILQKPFSIKSLNEKIAEVLTCPVGK